VKKGLPVNAENVQQLAQIDFEFAVAVFPIATSVEQVLLVNVKVAMPYLREPSASFLALLERNSTYLQLLELAVEYNYLEKDVSDFVRFLLQPRKVITRIESAEGVFDDECRTIRLDIIPEDQRTMDSEAERLCQLSFTRETPPWPVLFKLIQGESLSGFLDRIATSFGLPPATAERVKLFKAGPSPQSAQAVQRVKPEDVPWDVYAEDLSIVKIDWT
jgi:hypothetical protein